MRKTPFIVVFVFLFGLLGDVYFRDLSRVLGVIGSILFFVFFFIHNWMDKKGMLLPKKRD